jgi:hypothetical protein
VLLLTCGVLVLPFMNTTADAVKYDGCGQQRNNTRYAELMKAAGKNFSVENCAWRAGGCCSVLAGS